MRNMNSGILIGYLGLGILAMVLCTVLSLKFKIVLPNEILMMSLAVILIALILWTLVSFSSVNKHLIN